MLNGSRPVECDYCWGVEDNSDLFSDRIFKSSEDWSRPYMQEIKALDWRDDYNPKYVEVAFSNACNFKCSYCSPAYSSQWMEEIQEHGAYPTLDRFNDLQYLVDEHKMPLKHSELNPYTEAFWKWWPDLYKDLNTFRITGGEPLLSKDTWGVLDYIIENPNPNLELAINSNCVLPDKLFDKFIEKIKIIQETNAVKRFTLFTSAEAYGAKAEYIRHGMDYNIWLENCDKFLSEVPKVNFSIMSTYNALSVTSYMECLKDVLIMKLKHFDEERSINLDIPYLDNPKWMSVRILPTTYKDQIVKQINYMQSNHCEGKGFHGWEIAKLERIQYLFGEEREQNHLKDFALFFDEHDKRRNTNFLDTFPELASLYAECKSLT